jgi:hypothetical protein
MNAKKMFLSLIPWVLFSVMIERRGANAAGFAALAATVLALWLAAKDRESSGFKVIDLAGIATFGVLAVSCFVGGDRVTGWVADYGRGTATGVLAFVMLASAVTVPFTEQYARESVPREYWHSPVFRAVNRRISAVWGAVVAVTACGHLAAGALDPATSPNSGSRPLDLLLNWVVPVVLVLFAINFTRRAADNAGRADAANQADAGSSKSTTDRIHAMGR